MPCAQFLGKPCTDPKCSCVVGYADYREHDEPVRRVESPYPSATVGPTIPVAMTGSRTA